jgi:hypothetical protein
VSGAPVIRRFVMACTEADFHRLLPAAMGSFCYDAASRCFTGATAERSWRLCLADAGERRIALLRVPLTEVFFTFTGYTEAEVEAVMQRFFVYFQRGGG